MHHSIHVLWQFVSWSINRGCMIIRVITTVSNYASFLALCISDLIDREEKEKNAGSRGPYWPHTPRQQRFCAITNLRPAPSQENHSSTQSLPNAIHPSIHGLKLKQLQSPYSHPPRNGFRRKDHTRHCPRHLLESFRNRVQGTFHRRYRAFRQSLRCCCMRSVSENSTDPKGSVSSDRYNIQVIQLLLDSFAPFLAGSTIAAPIHAAADGFFLFGRIDCRPWFPGRREGSAAGGGFGTLARVDFGFQGCGFRFDDAEAAFDGVVRCACGLLVMVIEVNEM